MHSAASSDARCSPGRHFSSRQTCAPTPGIRSVAETCILNFDDPADYAVILGARVNLTISGAGDFKVQARRLQLNGLEAYRCQESLPRIAYMRPPARQLLLSLPVGAQSLISDGFALRNGDMLLHGSSQGTHQRCSGGCEWGLIALSLEPLAACSKALTGRPISSPRASKILRPARADGLRFQRLFAQTWRLADNARQKLFDRPEVARALEQELLHATINCLMAGEADDTPKARQHHITIMANFEKAIDKRLDQKLNMPALCAEIGLAERTLRMCCAEFLGMSPTRYVLLRRLNKARAALRSADPSRVTVAQVARDHQFPELGRFAVTYRNIFGESPSVTLQRNPQSAESA
nr:helix-turn-helix transcriptional regulator [Bradyrhizobium pachyrhizi]